MIKDFVAIDLETTGLSPNFNKITEIGAVKYVDGKEVSRFETLINPNATISPEITAITGISNEMVANSPTIDDIFDDLMEFLGDNILLGHNISFDYSFIAKAALDRGIKYHAKGIDTFKVSRRCISGEIGRSLEELCAYFDIETIHHRALADAVSAAEIYVRMCEIADSDNDVTELIFKPKKDEKITEKQIAFLESLIKRYRINYEKNVNELTKSEASREIDLILSTYGR